MGLGSCKMRLVAKGFTQTSGLGETFAPVAKLDSIKVHDNVIKKNQSP